KVALTRIRLGGSKDDVIFVGPGSPWYFIIAVSLLLEVASIGIDGINVIPSVFFRAEHQCTSFGGKSHISSIKPALGGILKDGSGFLGRLEIKNDDLAMLHGRIHLVNGQVASRSTDIGLNIAFLFIHQLRA